MLKILGENYYIDMDKVDEYVNVPNISGGVDNQISLVKFELVKTMIEVIITDNEPVDESLGEKSREITIPFKLAFNTLLNKKIINKY